MKKTSLLKQNCSQRQGKGHQPCVLHKAVSLNAPRTGATAPGVFISPIWGHLAVQDTAPSPELSSLHPWHPISPAAFPHCWRSLQTDGGQGDLPEQNFKPYYGALVLSQDLHAQHAPCLGLCIKVLKLKDL